MSQQHLLRVEYTPMTLRELALENLRNAIISGHFSAGERLIERNLSEELGVSRSVVREVIRYLEAEGLIDVLPKKGPIVAEITTDIARQIYQIRLTLEQNAVADCAHNACAGDKKILRNRLAKIALAYQSEDAMESLSASRDFYQHIFITAKHDIAWEVVQRLNSRISRLRAMTLREPDRTISGYQRMSAICRAIENNDPKAARKAVAEHISEAAALALSLLNRSEKMQCQPTG